MMRSVPKEFRGYWIGIPIFALAAICSLFVAIQGAVSHPGSGILPTCIGQDSLNDGFNFIDVFWTCADGYRLALMSVFASLTALGATGGGYFLARRVTKTGNSHALIKFLLAGFTVGLVYLQCIYILEYAFHHGYSVAHGSLPRTLVLGAPIAVSLIHFPSRWGLFASIPLCALGVVDLILIAWITGIPLD
ncbi:MAG: hypothetical protein ACKOUT_00020 [Novosphingobium sp.]